MAATLAVFIAGAPSAESATPVGEFDLASLREGQTLQARLLARAATDPGCKAQYALSELEGDGEHTTYRSVEMPGEIAFRLRVRAASRYGVQIGFASHDWSSYSLAAVSLISGAYFVAEDGPLKSVRSSVEPRPDGWIEINFNVANRSQQGGANAMGFAFIKLTAEGGAKEYHGRPVDGIELCAIGQ
jgi:hypothetical protein